MRPTDLRVAEPRPRVSLARVQRDVIGMRVIGPLRQEHPARALSRPPRAESAIVCARRCHGCASSAGVITAANRIVRRESRLEATAATATTLEDAADGLANLAEHCLLRVPSQRS
jgi:hypothetical protein